MYVRCVAAMDWRLLYFLLFIYIPGRNGTIMKDYLRSLRRQNSVLGNPTSLEELPRAERIVPGHTLLKPALGTLKSAAKFPTNDVGDTLVYGNINNISPTYGSTNERVLYTNFRKTNDLVKNIKNKLRKINQSYNGFRKASSIRQNSVLDNPTSLEELPRAERIVPGHTLLKPALKTLKSAAKFPTNDVGDTLVYGNINNISPTFGSTNERVLYTNYRKANDLVVLLVRTASPRRSSPLEGVSAEQENKASEILDIDEPALEYRREYLHRYRRRKSSSISSENDAASESSESSDFERNPGNPYTIHKDKYKQNWLWNFAMSGDHMNINPNAPAFQTRGGPSGADLFFGRKWWYYNQDDFVPLG